jgi:uncharacterized membrane protein YczE
MIKPIYWQTFPRDFAVIQIGFALFGLAIALLIRANLGASPWAVFEVALSNLTGITIGTASILVGFGVLAGAVTLKEQIGWGTLANILCIGPWIDVSLWLLPNVTDNLPVQIGYLLAAVVIMGLASAIYIGVDAGAGPRDSLMLALNRTTGVSVRLARGVIEVSVVLVGWLLGGPVGLGTLAFALLIGPSVQWAFRLFKVRAHQDHPTTVVPGR